MVHFNNKTEHLRVEWSEGLIVEPEDDVGTLPALSPGVWDDPAGEVGRAPLQHLDTSGGGWNIEILLKSWHNFMLRGLYVIIFYFWDNNMLLKLNDEWCCIVNVWEHRPVLLCEKTFVKLTDMVFSFLRTSLRRVNVLEQISYSFEKVLKCICTIVLDF